MIKITLKYLSIVGLLLGTLSCISKPKNGDDALLVYSAASLSDVMKELRDSFEVRYEKEVMLNFASSGTLARQIEHGGNPDVYLSANLRWAKYVDSLGYIVDTLMQNVAYNSLVLIAPKESSLLSLEIDSMLDLKILLGSRYLAMGNPAHVPAGKYAKETLEYYAQYLSLEENLLFAKDIRSALMMVEMGEAELGLVYATDAVKSQKVKVLQHMSEESHSRIRYVASLCQDNELALSFYKYINSDAALLVWEKHGFKK